MRVPLVPPETHGPGFRRAQRKTNLRRREGGRTREVGVTAHINVEQVEQVTVTTTRLSKYPSVPCRRDQGSTG